MIANYPRRSPLIDMLYVVVKSAELDADPLQYSICSCLFNAALLPWTSQLLSWLSTPYFRSTHHVYLPDFVEVNTINGLEVSISYYLF